MKIIDESFSSSLAIALETLRSGGVILYPTDTVWGIGCDATNAHAVDRIIEIKQRVEGKAMLSLVDSPAMLDRWVKDVPEITFDLLEAATEPLTVILDSPQGLASQLLASDGSAGFRVTNENFSRELVRRLRRPVVSTSANFSGEKAATDFESIDSKIISAVDYVCDYGRELGKGAKPSGIIKISAGGVFKIIR